MRTSLLVSAALAVGVALPGQADARLPTAGPGTASARVAAAILASPACTKTYLAGGGDWSVGANWSPTGVPATDDVACWATGDTVVVSGGSNGIRAIAGGTLSLTGGSLGVVSNFGDASNLTGLSVIGTGPSAWGTLNANSNASLTVAGPITLNGGEIENITLDQTSGAFSIGGSGTTNGPPTMAGPVITTSSPILLTNTSFSAINSTSITTTSTLSVPAGYATAGGSGTTISAAGLVTAGGTVTLSGIAVNLTGSSSSVTGTVSVAAITASAAASLTLTSPAMIAVTSSTGGNPTWSGALAGTGTLALDHGQLAFGAGSTVTGVAVIVGASGASSSAATIASDGFAPGSLTINAGSVTIATGVVASTGALTMTNASSTVRGTLDGFGTLTVNGDVELDNGLVSATVTQTGAHTLTVGGAGTGFTGRPELANATYTASDPGATALFTNNSFSTSNSTITIGGATMFAAGYGNDAGSSFSHLSAGSFVTAGGSDLAAPALTGLDMTITGGTTTLRAGTSTPGDWFVEPGATLTGGGGVAGRVTNHGGTVAPGGDGTVGAMAFAQGYSQTSGTLRVDVSSPTSNDQLGQTGGPAPSISGGTIAVTAIGGFHPTPSYDATIVDGTGSSGSATMAGVTVTDNLVGRHLTAGAIGSDVHLTLGTAVPDAPGIHAVAGDAQVTLTLTAPGSDGGLPIDLYTVTCSPDCGPAAPAHVPAATSFTVASTATPIVLTGLRNGTSYTFVASAHNGDGDGSASGPAVATPAHKPVGRATAMPATIVITGSTARITIRCTTDVGIPIKACTVTARDAKNRVVATATRSGSAAAITVVAKLNATGLKDASGSGGAAITVTASITPAAGAKLSATTTLTVTKKTTTITLVSDILFDSGSSTLKTAGVKALKKIAQQLRGAKQITCIGHTDADGSAAANQALGLARAKAVCAVLKVPGSKTRFVTKSKGATQPVAPNTTAANKAKNRRVEIKIVNA